MSKYCSVKDASHARCRLLYIKLKCWSLMGLGMVYISIKFAVSPFIFCSEKKKIVINLLGCATVNLNNFLLYLLFWTRFTLPPVVPSNAWHQNTYTFTRHEICTNCTMHIAHQFIERLHRLDSQLHSVILYCIICFFFFPIFFVFFFSICTANFAERRAWNLSWASAEQTYNDGSYFF